MPASYQQQSLFRKLIYFSLIGVLFAATLLLRQHVVLPRAEALGLREKNQGQVELTGSALRLTLTGSRGLVVCFLWMTAQDKQIRNEWNELELTVRALTKLQPHFITPWLFQSWNLAYNVSVESERLRDKYFYISRGIDLLSDGERQNQDNPDLRHHIGMYYQNKIGLSDEHTTFRCLFQLSCIDPQQRDPNKLRGVPGDLSAVNLEEFQKFCQAHPFLVRRLREALRYQSPREIVEFLETNRKVPSRFDERAGIAGGESTPLRPREERFPILPPRPARSAEYEYSNDSDLGDDFDCFLAARAWYSYSQEPLEPPLERAPRYMMPVIFQGYPARAQTYYAERLQKEGWFDEDPWVVADWFPQPGAGPDGPKQPVRLGDADRNWSGDAWRRAHEMYVSHGREHNLSLPPEEEEKLTPSQRSMYFMRRRVTNFDHFLIATEIESMREAVQARKCFWMADRLRRRGERRKAVAMYEDPRAFGAPQTWDKAAATGWTRLYYDHPKLRADLTSQEDTYDLEMKYMDLVTEVRAGRILPARTAVGVVSAGASAGAVWNIPAELLGYTGSPRVRGPFDGVDESGQPLVGAEAKRIVNSRRGIMAVPTAAPAQAPALVPGAVGQGR